VRDIEFEEETSHEKEVTTTVPQLVEPIYV
jgi:hypothetical protein